MLNQTFNISLPRDLVKKADLIARSEYKNRSELIKEALRQYINTNQVWNQLFEYSSKIGDSLKVTNEDEVINSIKAYRNAK